MTVTLQSTGTQFSVAERAGVSLMTKTMAEDTGPPIRSELCAAVIDALNVSGLAYCVLGGGDEGGDFSGSDLDFVVRPQDVKAIPELLASAARKAGAKLVQAIEHESAGTYFVIARQRGSCVGFVNPDCTADYRRDGRLWLYAEELLGRRGPGSNGFARPARDSEFLYYLIKQVLKQSLSEKQWRKLIQLQGGSAQLSRTLRFWPPQTAAQMEWAILQDQRAWFGAQREHLLEELKASPLRERGMARAKSLFADVERIVRRILYPTGLLVRVVGGSVEDRSELARALAEKMAPAFRRVWELDEPVPKSFWFARILHALIASTLIVFPGAKRPLRMLYRGIDVHWMDGASAEENLQMAMEHLISYLSRRTARRLGLNTAELNESALGRPILGDGIS